MSILITGGAGFIGSKIVKRLLSEGKKDLVVVDDLSSGSINNLKDCKSDITFIEGSILDKPLMENVMSTVDTVFHLAAKINVEDSIRDPFTTNLVNLEGTLGLLDLAKRNNVRRFIFSSSAAIYGNTNVSPINEEQQAIPLSPYGLQKYAAETYARYYSEFHNLSTVSLRYFNVYGPGQKENDGYSGVIYKFIKKALNKEPLTVYGSGKQTRDFVFIDDVVNANILAMKAPNTISGRSYNVGTGLECSVMDLCLKLRKILSYEIKIEHLEARSGDIERSCSNIKKISNDIGFKPQKDINEGLSSTLEWIKKSV
jgi:UDP-glucose 4-epimerase